MDGLARVLRRGELVPALFGGLAGGIACSLHGRIDRRLRRLGCLGDTWGFCDGWSLFDGRGRFGDWRWGLGRERRGGNFSQRCLLLGNDFGGGHLALFFRRNV